jgi:hypothetical protein
MANCFIQLVIHVIADWAPQFHENKAAQSEAARAAKNQTKK